MIIRTGGCLCGALRYEAVGTPHVVVHCYCEDCRRESGSDHLTHMAMPDSAVTITGVYAVYEKPHPNGTIQRLFCPNCGATILGRPASQDGVLNIRMGTLDEVGELKPTVAVFCSRARGWTRVDPDVEQHAELPRGD